jgi:phospholipase D1/2
MDFQHVDKWDQNEVSRLVVPRMGWSDVALSFVGPSVHELQRHFIQRWNFIYKEKYSVRRQERYSLLDESMFPGGHGHHRRRMKERIYGLNRPEEESYEEEQEYGRQAEPQHGVRIQVCRSCSKWSHGIDETENSICQAYISIIAAAQHFVYIENQFFITATDEKQNPILNRIGRAIVDRIIRAARNNEKFRIVVCIPAIPGFAGDLKKEDSLGTRAIMEFQ